MRKITRNQRKPQPADAALGDATLSPGQQEILDGYLGEQITKEALGKSDFKWRRGLGPVETVARLSRAAAFLEACAMAAQASPAVADVLARSSANLRHVHADMCALREAPHGAV